MCLGPGLDNIKHSSLPLTILGEHTDLSSRLCACLSSYISRSVSPNRINHHQALRCDSLGSLILALAQSWLTSEGVLTIRESGGD